jgi:hypothetical protein
MPEAGNKMRAGRLFQKVFLWKVSLLLRENAHVTDFHQLKRSYSFISKRYQLIDSRSSTGGDVAGDQGNHGQQYCQHAIRHHICWSNTEQ